MAEAAQQLPPEEEIELCEMELRSYAYTRGVREGREAGAKEVLATLHETLIQRGIELDPLSRARIEQCDDPGQLSRWLVRAAMASSAAELFD